MRPTPLSTLFAVAMAVGALSWGALRISLTQGLGLPALAWSSPAGVAVLALVVLVSTIALRRRLGSDRPPNPLGTARMAVLGKASAHVGAIVGGLYAGYLLVLLPGLGVESRRDRAVLCAVALVAAALLTAAGLFLERTCRVRGSDDDPQPPEAPAT